ncbi:Uma2 family endonuclease [Nocardioides humilatus]|nr:Uma2 family endonuclease [Nocardioides humilatus]
MSTELIAGPWTYADLEDLPDDGRRYEIIDGLLIVNASPIPDHQGIVLSLSMLLRDAAPADVRVLPAPMDVVLADDTVVEPDVLVARRSDFGPKNLPGPPLLAVEVLSPSTRVIDLNLKKERFERAGIPSYWIVDPADLHFTAFELVDGHYVEVADLADGDQWEATLPFPVTVVPAELRY